MTLSMYQMLSLLWNTLHETICVTTVTWFDTQFDFELRLTFDLSWHDDIFMVSCGTCYLFSYYLHMIRVYEVWLEYIASRWWGTLWIIFHELGIFMLLVQFYVFLKISSAYRGWYGELLRLNWNMQTSALWLNLALHILAISASSLLCHPRPQSYLMLSMLYLL